VRALLEGRGHHGCDVVSRRPRILLALTGLVVVGGCGSPSAGDVVPALDRPQAEQDRLPTSDGRTSAPGVDADSTRRLGSTRTADYWVGRDGEDVCLVQRLVGTQVTGSSCLDLETFEEVGLFLSTGSADSSATGLLVPLDFDLADAGTEEEWVQVQDNLATRADEVAP
jgi:hypothetical protein